MIVLMVGIVCVLIAGVCWIRVRNYRSWFQLPARRSDALDLSCGGQSVALTVGRQGFDLPAGLNVEGRTLLLALTVDVPAWNALRDPFIEIRRGGRAFRQYFERAAAGERYLNISPLFQSDAAESRVRMSGTCINWNPQARLLIFDAPAIDDATVLVLAPHPDDAEVAAYGIYARTRSWIAAITAGERATGPLPAALPTGERSGWAAWLRAWDSQAVPALGGVPPERRVSLAYPDGELESMYRAETRSFRLACEPSLSRSELRSRNRVPQFRQCTPECTWGQLVEDIRRLLELTQPDIVICPHPLIDNHPDHVFTTVALERALHLWRGKSPRLFLYAVHSRGAPAYPFGPAESLVGVPPGAYSGCPGESLYSHPLDGPLRTEKYFAVDAMRAARAQTVDTEARDFLGLLRVIRREVSAYFVGLGPHPASLLRRAPRPNEIYYVLRGALLSELTQRAVETGRGPP